MTAREEFEIRQKFLHILATVSFPFTKDEKRALKHVEAKTKGLSLRNLSEYTEKAVEVAVYNHRVCMAGLRKEREQVEHLSQMNLFGREEREGWAKKVRSCQA